MISRASRLALAALVAIVGSTSAGAAAEGAHRAESTAHRPAAPAAVPARKVFMVSDSVGLGAATAMQRAFPSDWEVTVTGKPAQFVEQLVDRYVNPMPASAFGDFAIVAGGYNYTYWDVPRFDRAIDYMVDSLVAKGVKQVFWYTLREVKPQFYSGWNSLAGNYKLLYSLYPIANSRLRAALDRHPQLSIIDWAATTDQTGLTYDAIHLNPTGAGLYAGLAAGAIRNASSRRPAGTVTEFTVAGVGGVPADASAVSLNITAVNPRTAGYLTAYPCGGTMPIVSNLNFVPDQTIASAAIVPIGANGKVCVYQSSDSHVLVDLNGAFAADSGFVALVPTRAIDTRSGPAPAADSRTVVHLGAIAGAPAGAFTAVVNLTVVNGDTTGGVTLYPCDAAPPAQVSRTIGAGLAQNLTMVTATDPNGDVCVTVTHSGHVLVDLFGAFPLTASFHAITAQRLLDTRGGFPLAGGEPRTQQIAGVAGVPATPQPSGVVLTLTLLNPAGPGWATIYPCATGQPDTSMINVVSNHEQTNAVIPAIDAAGTVCLYTSTTSHVLLDVSGWSGAAFLPLTPARLVDTRNG
ncbi:MAG: hypothetical protein WCC60_12045 [Ilumatobacteraceae bacterium]